VVCDAGEVCDRGAGGCRETHCDTCTGDAGCGEGAECAALASGDRCLLACETDEDCEGERVCAAQADGGSYCFDQSTAGGDCAEPVEEPEVVEPAPEVTEDDDFIASGGTDCSGGGGAAGLLGLLALAILRIRRPHPV
jgi:hypothetical protein